MWHWDKRNRVCRNDLRQTFFACRAIAAVPTMRMQSTEKTNPHKEENKGVQKTEAILKEKQKCNLNRNRESV